MLFGRVATAAYRPAVIELVKRLNEELDQRADGAKERDAIASFWISQDEQRMIPSHFCYLMQEKAFVHGESVILVPKQPSVEQELNELVPCLEMPHQEKENDPNTANLSEKTIV